jgi:protocatechuate 3,4-dioxygenase beta subunit
MKLPFPSTRRTLLAAGKLSRREILKGGAATSLVVALPACGAENNPGPDTSTSPVVTTDTSSSTTTTTTTSSATTSAQPSPPTPPTNPPTPPTNPPAQTSTPTTSSSTTSEPTTSSSSAESSEAPTSEPTSEASTAEVSSGETSAPPTNGELTVPSWDDVPTCDASRTDGAGQGPFFIHNEEKEDDIELFRQDIRGQYNPQAEEGTEMHLHLRILDTTSDACNAAPVGDVEVYIWHTDPQGYYSGFGNPGDQKPDEPYAGVPNQNDLDNTDRFCRGAAVTDANGVVSFKSYFPGWYNGRDLHIHLVVLKKGSASRGRQTYSGGDHLFTTQFYFDPEFSDQIHKASEPYLRRTTLSAYTGAIQADEQGNSNLHAKASLEGGVVVAQMQILLDPKV